MNQVEHLRTSEEHSESVIHDKLVDAQTPGFQAECDPDEAERLGAFVEDAISEADATDRDIDLEEAHHAER